jgi:hypothetical protein
MLGFAIAFKTGICDFKTRTELVIEIEIAINLTRGTGWIIKQRQIMDKLSRYPDKLKSFFFRDYEIRSFLPGPFELIKQILFSSLTVNERNN